MNKLKQFKWNFILPAIVLLIFPKGPNKVPKIFNTKILATKIGSKILLKIK